MKGWIGWLPDFFNKYMPSAYYMLGTIQSCGNIFVNEIKSQCSWISYCDRKRHTINK